MGELEAAKKIPKLETVRRPLIISTIK